MTEPKKPQEKEEVYVGTYIKRPTWKKLKANAAAAGQSIASRLKLMIENNT